MNPQEPNQIPSNPAVNPTPLNPLVNESPQNVAMNPVVTPVNNPTFTPLQNNPDPTSSQPTPFGSVSQPVSPLLNNAPKNKKIIFVVIALIVMLLVIGGVVLAMNSKSSTKNNSTKTSDSSKSNSDIKNNNQHDGLVCKEFAPSDFDVVVNGAPDKTDGFFVTYKTKSENGKPGKNNLFFKYLFTKNTKNYESQEIVDRSLLSVVRFNEQNKDNKWNLSLSGSFSEETEANKKLANERTEKVKSDLIKAGIPESRLIIKDAAKATGTSFNYVDIDDRYVQAIIGANCS